MARVGPTWDVLFVLRDAVGRALRRRGARPLVDRKRPVLGLGHDLRRGQGARPTRPRPTEPRHPALGAPRHLDPSQAQTFQVVGRVRTLHPRPNAIVPRRGGVGGTTEGDERSPPARTVYAARLPQSTFASTTSRDPGGNSRRSGGILVIQETANSLFRLETRSRHLGKRTGSLVIQGTANPLFRLETRSRHPGKRTSRA